MTYEYKSGYQEALAAAGAVVHVFEEFGSYQGDWWAKVTYKGKTGWIKDYYGSCSGCDAFQAEMDWCCDTESEKYKKQLADFGAQYLERDLWTNEEAEQEAAKNYCWDVTAEEMVKFIRDNSK